MSIQKVLRAFHGEVEIGPGANAITLLQGLTEHLVQAIKQLVLYIYKIAVIHVDIFMYMFLTD